jgi:hypothetical protein
VEKRSSHLCIRITDEENYRLGQLAHAVGADRSSLMRLAIKRLLRNPPVRRFRFRVKRGAKL